MTDTDGADTTKDPSASPEYEQLGEAGNPFSAGDRNGSASGIDQVPSQGDTGSDDEQNPPLPDWGPTDGTHGVDGADPTE